jgi:CRISPR-associated protein Cas1
MSRPVELPPPAGNSFSGETINPKEPRMPNSENQHVNSNGPVPASLAWGLPDALPELIPARMLNEFAYCPRLAYLEWVQGEFAESADTLDGTYQHRRVNRPGGALPAGSHAGVAARDREERETIHSRSVHLSGPKVGLVAIIDLLEGKREGAVPLRQDAEIGPKPVAEPTTPGEAPGKSSNPLLLRARKAAQASKKELGEQREPSDCVAGTEDRRQSRSAPSGAETGSEGATPAAGTPAAPTLPPESQPDTNASATPFEHEINDSPSQSTSRLVVTPVDYKRGRVPDIPERAWEPERVQLCAQGLILRENGYHCEGGVLYFVESKTRVPVPFDEALVARTLELLARMRQTAAGGRIPPPLVDSPKCPRCSLVGICLPDETRLLAEGRFVQVTVEAAPLDGHEDGATRGRRDKDEHEASVLQDGRAEDSGDAPAKSIAPTEPRVRMLIAQGGDGRPLYVTEPRAFVGKSGDLVQVRAPAEALERLMAAGESAGRVAAGPRGRGVARATAFEDRPVIAQVRLAELSHVCLFGSPQISTQLVHELCDRQIPVAYFSAGGYFRGMTTGMPSKNIELRIAQYRLAADNAFRLALAKAWVAGKIENQRTLLRRNHADAPARALNDLKDSIEQARRTAGLESLLGIEGNAARIYFGQFQGMLRPRTNATADDGDAASIPGEDADDTDEKALAAGSAGGVPRSDEDGPTPPPDETKASITIEIDDSSSAHDEQRAADHPQPDDSGAPDGRSSSERASSRSDDGPSVAAARAFRFDFAGRNRRPPVDPVNALLSLGYAVLSRDLTAACWIAGLDPFLGFFHTAKYGRPALALDLMEEFRALIVDSTVLTAINTGVVSPTDFIHRGPAVALRPEGRRRFLQAYERRIETLVTHPIFGYRISYRRLLEVQARLLSRVLLGEIPAYVPFTTR